MELLYKTFIIIIIITTSVGEQIKQKFKAQ